jgi:competence protein ComEA
MMTQQTHTPRSGAGLPALARATLLTLGLGAALLTPALAGAQEGLEEPAGTTVNINTADAEALAAALTGIGASRAEAIVRYREMYGPFDSLEELTDVSGVGPATLEQNRDRITLD